MRTLSDRARSLIARLYDQPNVVERLLGRGGSPLDTLADLVDCNEPAAIPHIVPILVFGNGREIEGAAAAIEVLLAQTTVEDLPCLDEAMRGSWLFGTYGEQWRGLKARELAKWMGPGEPGVLLLRLSSFHQNGFVREEAIRRLRLIYDGSELPYLLLRVNDWVPEVHRAALDSVLERINADYSAHFVTNLALIIRLQKARRTDHLEVLQKISQLLSGPVALDPLRARLNDCSREIRRASFHFLVAGKPADLRGVLLAALEVNDPIVRLLSARHVGDAFANEQLPPVLQKLCLDSSASVRREGLRAWVTFFSREARGKLMTALLDRNASVRDEARFHLQGKWAVDFPRFYREAMKTTLAERLSSSISGLGETGIISDAEIVTPYLSHLSAKVRRAAVRCIIRLGGEQYAGLALDKVLDTAPSVSAQARKGLQPYVASIGAKRLWTLFEENPSGHIRRNLLHLLAALPKWESIVCLIRAANEDDEAIARQARQYAIRWNAQYNRIQTAPSSEQLIKIEAALARSESKLDASIVDEIRFTVRSFKRG